MGAKSPTMPTSSSSLRKCIMAVLSVIVWAQLWLRSLNCSGLNNYRLEGRRFGVSSI